MIENTILKIGIVKDARDKSMKDLRKISDVFSNVLPNYIKAQDTLTKLTNPVIEMKAKLEESLNIHEDMNDVFNSKRIVIPVTPIKNKYELTEDFADLVANKIEKSFKKNKQIKSSDNDKLISLPSDAKWEDIRMDMTDNKSLKVYFKKKYIGEYDYKDLGLAKKSSDKLIPTKQIEVLTQFSWESMLKGEFKLTALDMARSLGISIDSLYQNKRALSNKLKSAFDINSDPFYPYDKTSGYRLRFELRPESSIRGDGDIHLSGGQLYDETTKHNDDE